MGHAGPPAREDSLDVSAGTFQAFSDAGEQSTPMSQGRAREITRNSGDASPIGEVTPELEKRDSQLGSRSQANRLAIQSAGATPIDGEGPLPYWTQISLTLRRSGVPATVHPFPNRRR